MQIVSNFSGRLDIYLTNILNESRNQINNFIKYGNVIINNKIIKKSGFKVNIGDKIELKEVTKTKSDIRYSIDFDIDILYEDDDILVINKPSGVVIHDAPSVKEATIVDWLKDKNISLSTISGEERHGIVHRLDKGTSGAMVVAKNNNAHKNLSLQLQQKSMGRLYLTVINYPLKDDIIVEKPIGRNPKNRLKMDIVPNGRYAKTKFFKLLVGKENTELVLAKLYTGRTHQIRVHLKSISRYILGDDLYGFKDKFGKISRILLHAYILYLKHPISGKEMFFSANIDDELYSCFGKYFNKDMLDEKISKDFVSRVVGF